MTLILLAAGAVLCAANTKLAAIVLGAAAVWAAADGGPFAVPSTWAAITAAALVVLDAPPRRLALPLLGASAVLVAASSANAATVLPAWAVAGAAATVQAARSRVAAERAWTLWLLFADLFVAAALAWAVIADGFSSWPPRAATVPLVLLALSSVVRVPLSAGALDRAPESGLVLVRTQVVVLALLVADPALAPSALLTALGLGGAAVFALSGLLQAAAMRDAVQEAGLVLTAVGGAALGWSSDWTWGALAGGTLVHLVRVADPRGTPALRFLGWIARGGSLGSPLVPAVVAISAGAAAQGGFAPTCAAALLFAGLGTRALAGVPEARRAAAASRRLGAGIAALAVLAGLAGHVLTVPRSLAGGGLGWLPPWALVLVASGGALGYLLYDRTVPARTRRAPEVWRLDWLRPPGDLRLVGRLAAVTGALTVPLLALALCAAGLFVLGVARGFL